MRKLVILLGLLMTSLSALGADMSNGADNFYKSEKVTMQKVAFKNQYQMKTVGNLFVPKDLKPGRKSAAIPLPSIYRSGAKVMVNRATRFHQKSMLKTSVQLWITSAHRPSLIGTGLVSWAFVVAGASSSALPRSTLG